MPIGKRWTLSSEMDADANRSPTLCTEPVTLFCGLLEGRFLGISECHRMRDGMQTVLLRQSGCGCPKRLRQL
jgi:hypothetical protein